MIVIDSAQERPCRVMQCRPTVHMNELLTWIPTDTDFGVGAPQVVTNLRHLDAADAEINGTRVAMGRRRRFTLLDAVYRDQLDGPGIVLLGQICEHREGAARDRSLSVGLPATKQMLHFRSGPGVHRTVTADADRRADPEILVVQLDLYWSRRPL